MPIVRPTLDQRSTPRRRLGRLHAGAPMCWSPPPSRPVRRATAVNAAARALGTRLDRARRTRGGRELSASTRPLGRPGRRVSSARRRRSRRRSAAPPLDLDAHPVAAAQAPPRRGARPRPRPPRLWRRGGRHVGRVRVGPAAAAPPSRRRGWCLPASGGDSRRRWSRRSSRRSQGGRARPRRGGPPVRTRSTVGRVAGSSRASRGGWTACIRSETMGSGRCALPARPVGQPPLQ